MSDGNSLFRSLLNIMGGKGGWTADDPFKPFVRHYPEMDLLLHMQEDVSFRADQASCYLTVLLHPYEDRLVGIQIHGWTFVAERLVSIIGLDEPAAVPLWKAVAFCEPACVVQRNGRLDLIGRALELSMSAQAFAEDTLIPAGEFPSHIF